MSLLCKVFDPNNRGSIDYTEFAKQIYRPTLEKPKVSLVSETIAEEIKEE